MGSRSHASESDSAAFAERRVLGWQLSDLWEDGERVFHRGWRLDDDGKRRDVLIALPAADHPSRLTLVEGYAVLQQLFFAPTETSQKAGKAFTDRLMQRGADREPISGPAIAQAQIGAFREWEKSSGERFVDLKGIRQPTLVVNGVHDDMIPIRNSYWLSEHLPNAVLLTYPDAGHGSLFQFHESVTRQAAAFLGSDSDFAPY